MSNITRREAIAVGLVSGVAVSVPFVWADARGSGTSDQNENPAVTGADGTLACDHGKAALAIGCRFDRSF